MEKVRKENASYCSENVGGGRKENVCVGGKEEDAPKRGRGETSSVHRTFELIY